MPNIDPKIAIIMPVYNAAAFIHATLKSVFAQTYSSYELIVIDDGSTDQTKSIITSCYPKVNYHYQPNAGSASAVNTGMKLTTAPYIAFLDHDDLWHPDKLEKQMLEFKKNPELEAVYCLVDFFLDQSIKSSKRYAVPKQPMKGYLRSCILFKRSILPTIGYFNEKLKVAESIEWISRIKDAAIQQQMIDEVLTHRRIHSKNTSLLKKANYKELLLILKDRINQKNRLLTKTKK